MASVIVPITSTEYTVLNTGLVSYSVQSLAAGNVYIIAQAPGDAQPAADATHGLLLGLGRGVHSDIPGYADMKLWAKTSKGAGSIGVAEE